MDLIEDIGPILGIVAFLGFAILALLIVLQAREVRRLREWAGRAPERALEADEAADAAREAEGELEGEAEPAPGLLAGARERVAAARERVAGAVGPRWAELDRRSPVDARWLLAAVAAALIAVGVGTSGFGLFGGDDEPRPVASEDGGNGGGGGGGGGDRDPQEPDPRVAVLNATQVEDDLAPVPAVPGLADQIANQVVEPAGFDIQVTTNAPVGEERTLIMFEPDAEADAEELAAAIEDDLGETEIAPMSAETRGLVDGAELALLIGQDDSEFGQV